MTDPTPRDRLLGPDKRLGTMPEFRAARRRSAPPMLPATESAPVTNRSPI